MKSHLLILAVAAVAGISAAGAQERATQDRAGQGRVLIASAALPESSTDTPSTVIPAPCQVASDATMVQEQLRRFDTALASRDMVRLEATGIQPLSLKRWQRFFKDNPEATVTDRCPIASLFIMDDTASWNCMETTTISSGKKQVAMEHIIHFTFSKKDGAWVIADRN
jgi:hypothetical protein